MRTELKYEKVLDSDYKRRVMELRPKKMQKFKYFMPKLGPLPNESNIQALERKVIKNQRQKQEGI
jgi:hypothetical protein